MILPNQITNHEFTTVKGMYKPEEVDEFLAELANDYDKTFRENGELVKKLGILADKVEDYRAEEDNIRVALLAAQKAGSELTKAAKETAEATLREAKQEAAELVESAEKEATQKVADANAYSAKTISEAEQNAHETLTRAQNNASVILADAKFKAESLVAEANEEAERATADYLRNKKIEEVALEAIKKETAKFKGELLEMYRAHISLINEIPALIEVDESDFEEEDETAAEPVVEESVPAEAVEAPAEELSVAEEAPAQPEEEDEPPRKRMTMKRMTT